MITPNKLHEYQRSLKDVNDRIKAVIRNYTEGRLSLLGHDKKMAELLDRQKVVQSWIDKLGRRYNTVRVFGKCRTNLQGNAGSIKVSSKFEMFYTDISLGDAQHLAIMYIGEKDILSINMEVIPTGELRILSLKPGF